MYELRLRKLSSNTSLFMHKSLLSNHVTPLRPLTIDSLISIRPFPNYVCRSYSDHYVIIKTYTVFYSCKNIVCIDAVGCHRVELIVGQAGKSSAFAFAIICDELNCNNIEIDIETLSFHINTCLNEYEEIYKGLSNEVNRLSFLALLSSRC